MDHAISALMTYFDVELEYLMDEYNSGKYPKLSVCPSYPAAKALLKAIHEMEKYYYGKARTSSVKSFIVGA